MTWHLTGTGRRTTPDWPTLHAFTEGWDAAWADLTGFHLEPMPNHPPITTHLWAWKPGHWLRARIDGETWWAALLTSTDTPSGDLWQKPEPIPEPKLTRLMHWQAEEGQVHQFRGTPGTLNRDDFIQLTPLRPTTAPFIGHTTTHS